MFKLILQLLTNNREQKNREKKLLEWLSNFYSFETREQKNLAKQYYEYVKLNFDKKTLNEIAKKYWSAGILNSTVSTNLKVENNQNNFGGWLEDAPPPPPPPPNP